MKELLAGIVLIIVIGLAGFLYRYEIERPLKNAVTIVQVGGNAMSTACAQDAKICPDGSAVARTGADCTFATCPAPNVELSNGSTTIAFVLPSGYKQVEQGTPTQPVLRIYQKPIKGSTDQGDVLTVSEYSIPAGGSADAVMLANTIFDPSGIQATSTNSFVHVTIGKYTFDVVQIGRYEGQVETAYYLARANDVLRFDLIERGVTNWTDPNLNIPGLPEHQSLQSMLATLQVS